MTRDEIYETLVDVLAESFELKKAEITREAKLYEELGLDSIDAVDIFVQLREITGRRPDPARAREVRTVDDLITFVVEELEAKAKGYENLLMICSDLKDVAPALMIIEKLLELVAEQV